MYSFVWIMDQKSFIWPKAWEAGIFSIEKSSCVPSIVTQNEGVLCHESRFRDFFTISNHRCQLPFLLTKEVMRTHSQATPLQNTHTAHQPTGHAHGHTHSHTHKHSPRWIKLHNLRIKAYITLIMCSFWRDTATDISGSWLLGIGIPIVIINSPKFTLIIINL